MGERSASERNLGERSRLNGVDSVVDVERPVKSIARVESCPCELTLGPRRRMRSRRGETYIVARLEIRGVDEGR